MATKKKKTVKKKKQKKISTIRNRLFGIWSQRVRERANNQCEYCGIKKGDINKNGKATKIDAHHLLSRDVKDSPLKFDLYNGIAVCPTCHKFGEDSFHRCPITTINWLIKNRPERYLYVLNNHTIKVDLENRKVLEIIEEQIKELDHLDLDKIKEIEVAFPRIVKTRKQVQFKGNLFGDDSESSSSSSN